MLLCCVCALFPLWRIASGSHSVCSCMRWAGVCVVFSKLLL
jgi:hypothetical protein